MENFKREYEVLSEAMEWHSTHYGFDIKEFWQNEQMHRTALQYQNSKEITNFVKHKYPTNNYFEHKYRFKYENWKIYKLKYKLINFIRKYVENVKMKYENE